MQSMAFTQQNLDAVVCFVSEVANCTMIAQCGAWGELLINGKQWVLPIQRLPQLQIPTVPMRSNQQPEQPEFPTEGGINMWLFWDCAQFVVSLIMAGFNTYILIAVLDYKYNWFSEDRGTEEYPSLMKQSFNEIIYMVINSV